VSEHYVVIVVSRIPAFQGEDHASPIASLPVTAAVFYFIIPRLLSA
jgi:hypothetical protein